MIRFFCVTLLVEKQSFVFECHVLYIYVHVDILILSLHFLWESSLVSIQVMAKDYNPFAKSGPSIVLNDSEQKIDVKNEPKRLVYENKKMVINDNPLQSSQNFLKKICKITINSLLLNQEELKSNDISGYSSDGKENISRRLSRKFSAPIILRRGLSETPADSTTIAAEKPLPKVCVIFK